MKYIIIYLILFFPFDLISQYIKFGNQIWTSVDLNVTNYRNGDPIIRAESSYKWNESNRLKKGAYCIYEGNVLYNWYAVNDERGLAPIGYRIPTSFDWLNLLLYLNVPVKKVGASGVLKKSGYYSYNN